MSRPRLLDLFCGAGGAAMGYYRAGFDVVGVDKDRQPDYPFEFYQGDALTYPLDGFDVIHASPPCQRFSVSVSRVNRQKHPDLIALTRERLRATGAPYIIENVPRAPLVDYITLCGSSFGLKVRRHRRFESNVLLFSRPCAHKDVAYPPMYAPAWSRTTPNRVRTISGGWSPGQLQEPDAYELDCQAMGIDWMPKAHDLSEAIPPAYTEWIGHQLIRAMVPA